jgi:hypothetical protein
VALMGKLGVKHLLAGLLYYTVELESTFTVLTAGVAVSNGSFSAVSLSLLYFVHLCVSQLFFE